MSTGGILFLESRFISDSSSELCKLQGVVVHLLDVLKVQGLNSDGGTSLTCVFVPQNEYFRLNFIAEVQGISELSEEVLLRVSKEQYPELFTDGIKRSLVKIDLDCFSNHRFFVLRVVGRSHPFEETVVSHSQILENETTAHSDEKFLSPLAYATSDNPNLCPSRKNAATVNEDNEIKIKEANQVFNKDQEGDPVEDNLIDDAPISIHGASSAKHVYSNNLPCSEANTGKLYDSKHFDFKWRAPRAWGRLRSVSESDAMDYGEEEDQSQSDGDPRDSLDVTRSLPTKLPIAVGIEPEARVWDKGKSEIVISEVKKPIIVADVEKVKVELNGCQQHNFDESLEFSSRKSLDTIIPYMKENGSNSLSQHTFESAPSTPTVKSPIILRMTRSESDLASKVNQGNLTEINERLETVVPLFTEALKNTQPSGSLQVITIGEENTLTGENDMPTEQHSSGPSLSPNTAEAISPGKCIDAEESSISGAEDALSDTAVPKPSVQASPQSCLNHGLPQLKEGTAESFDCADLVPKLGDNDNICKGACKEKRTMVITVEYLCNGDSSPDESFCCPCHSHQWSQNVLGQVERLLPDDLSIQESDIYVKRNLTEDNSESQLSCDCSEESAESFMFPPPIDCRSQNLQENIPVIPGAASCPTQLLQHCPLASGKASSVPVKAPEAAACVGHLTEIDEHQEGYYQVQTQKGLANKQTRDNVEDSSSPERHNVDLVLASEAEPSHQVFVYPERPHRIPRHSSHLQCGNRIPEIAGNLMLGGRLEEFDERNQAVVVNKVEDNSNQMLKGAAVNMESKAIRRNNVNTFLDNGHYANIKPGIIIYATDLIPLMEGESCLHIISQKHNKILGHGGNGKVYELLMQGVKYAVKMTDYRCGELNAWHKLNHPHLIPLLAVGIGFPDDKSPRRTCYQFMPLMSGSVRDCMKPFETLYKLSQHTGLSIDLMSNNVLYISKCCLEALDYLAMKNMQHHDVKGSNVLVHITCGCPDIWCCGCAWSRGKFLVMLADLDSVQETKETINPKHLPRIKCRMKTILESIYDPGTIGIHAPEELVVPVETSSSYNKTIVGGSQETVENNLCGWWCDNWSLGWMIVAFYEGRDDGAKDRRDRANILLNQPNSSNTYSSRNEALIAFVALKDFLCSANRYNSAHLNVTADLANECMNPDFKARRSASELLAWLADKGLK